MQFTEVATRS